MQTIFKRLKARSPLPPLEPTKPWDSKLSASLKNFDGPEALKAALLLWNDDLGSAHKIAQDIADDTGSLIHAVMHRRETEYLNSKYWLRRAGDHPVITKLKSEFGGWDPLDHVDRCEKASGSERAELERIQARELELIVLHCRSRSSA